MLHRHLRTLTFAAALCLPFAAAFTSEKAPDRALVEKLITDQLGSWESEDEELFLSTAHPDLIFAYPGDRLDSEGALKVFRFWAENYSETKVYIHEVVIEGSKFSVEYQFATTRDRDGARSVSGTVAVGEVVDEKLIIWKEYLDGRVSRMQVEGKLPMDEGEEPFPWPLVDEKSE